MTAAPRRCALHSKGIADSRCCTTLSEMNKPFRKGHARNPESVKIDCNNNSSPARDPQSGP